MNVQDVLVRNCSCISDTSAIHGGRMPWTHGPRNPLEGSAQERRFNSEVLIAMKSHYRSNQNQIISVYQLIFIKLT
jgi:hypothetical protein